MAAALSVDLPGLRAWFRRNRRRTRAWFEMVAADAYYARPIRLRHPLVFYEGHVAAFNVNTLVKLALGWDGIDAGLEALFERGIDPAEDDVTQGLERGSWPARAEVLRFAEGADALVERALAAPEVVADEDPLLRRGLSIHTILEHEAMHHETLLYMFHQLPTALKRRPSRYGLGGSGVPPPAGKVRIPAGTATLGADPDTVGFGWDNEFRAHPVEVPAFAIDVHDVTNADFLAFVAAGGYRERAYWTPADWQWREREGVEHPMYWKHVDGEWSWRGFFGDVPLPAAWPVYVSHAEASAYARWRGERLPTEAEYQRAAFGTPDGRERAFPWGDDPPGAAHGNFGLHRFDPVPVGSFPAGASAWGVHDLVGNGWEWTATPFAPFEGFAPMPSYPRYSADFFDGEHYVLKGASPGTAREMVRRTWRNWFRPRYPYPYATFRCVSD